MDAIQINRNNKVEVIMDLSASTHDIGTSAPIYATFIRDMGDKLLIAFNHNMHHRIQEGQNLVFMRYFSGEDGEQNVISSNIKVLEKVNYIAGVSTLSGTTETLPNENDEAEEVSYDAKIEDSYDAVYASKPEHMELRLPIVTAPKLKFFATSGECENDYDCYFDDIHKYLLVKIGDDFVINDWLYHYNIEHENEDNEEYFIVEFDRDHNIFAQDIYVVKNTLMGDYSIDVEDENGGKIGRLEGISTTFNGLPYATQSGDTLKWRTVETCQKFDGSGRTFDAKEFTYTYLPDDFSRRRLIFTSASTTQMDGDFFATATYLLTHGKVFKPIYNPYYFYTMQTGDKICTLWFDPWWPVFNDKNNDLPRKEIYITNGVNKCLLGMRSDFWSVPSLSLAENSFIYGLEDGEGEEHVNSIIDSLIPEVIDMERYKYVPVIFDEENKTYSLVKSLIFDFHFRKRRAAKNIKSKLAETEKYPIYDEGWYISPESGNTVWWNGFQKKKDGEEDKYEDYAESGLVSDIFSEYYEASGATSDLLGYLGFDDEDVYYRKSKITKTFIRLSFYTSTDPLSQKLLYYSTSFLDGTALYGHYMKQSQMKESKYGDLETTPIVFYPDNSVSARVDTEIVIKNEFNHMASSEGFNIYLFGDDATKTDEGKNYRTIYMKVEFNHAGNGKTIPMVLWPKEEEGDGYRQLITDTFLKDLYIPVRIGYLDGKFCYWFGENTQVENEDGNLRFILFEPKLTYTADGNSDEHEEETT